MEQPHDTDKDNIDKHSNTEYVPTKCRITRPPPPKPATNPLQFIKVAPCPLYRKAQEQLKKVEEIKTTKQHIREEAEDWQQNLDNWKSSRRKRQEHIIERVVEVKKLEHEEQQRTRRKSKTFSEMIEDRNKGRHKFNIPIYDDDSNDLSDYGIGSSSSKTNSIKDADTDDNSSILDEKDHVVFESTSGRDTNVSSNQSQSEDEVSGEKVSKEGSVPKEKQETYRSNYSSSLYPNTVPKPALPVSNSLYKMYNTYESEVPKPEVEQYTYEGAIEDYRTRIKSKINVNESVFKKPTESTKSKEYLESQTVVPKGQIFKRKEIFELEKPIEIHHIGSSTSRRLSEDFVNTQSIKERLQNFEKCVEQSAKEKPVPPLLPPKNRKPEIKPKISEKPITKREDICDRSSSPETELYMNKLNMFNNDLDKMFGKHSNSSENELDDMGSNCNYPASTSSTELTGLLSDREDSGIHTADVSCSVSQADEPVEYSDITSPIPSCIEKLSLQKDLSSPKQQKFPIFTKEYIIKQTEDFLENARKHTNDNTIKSVHSVPSTEIITKPVIYENVELKPNLFAENYDALTDFTLAPPKVIEPPKVKPPPPPPAEIEDSPTKTNVKRLNSTKRIKKEIHIKRSSFLGLSDSYDDPIEAEVALEKPPDIYSFLQKESKLEKSMYKKLQENSGSQDSGLDVERGRLSSDTWCSSVGDSSTASHGRQDSEHTNSITSEEDEITKKEREIIELVEKEEKSRDNSECPSETHTFNDLNYYSQRHDNSINERDSEVLKVEQELLQLEKEQLRRQHEQLIFSKRLQSNRRSLENVCDNFSYPQFNHRKSMPELQHVPQEYRKPFPEGYLAYNHRKSMPDIQHAYLKSSFECQKPELSLHMNHRKSMPELKSAFCSPMHKPAILPGKPLVSSNKQMRQMPRHQFPSVNPAPKIIPTDNWIQPRPNQEIKNYNQHWLYQEAELRRISDLQASRNRQPKQEKHPEKLIPNLSHRKSSGKDYLQQHSYLNPHSQTLGHALPMSYPQPLLEDGQDRMLSVSGKKKCSYCGNELGRGAAMIIESLCLFYHMECFKCCVCHMQLGDGLMGTDVRVRNQKLHCHNCYSSDDGVKFSCV